MTIMGDGVKSDWVMRGARLSPEMNEALEAFAETMDESSMSAAIRTLLAMGLEQAGKLKQSVLISARDNATGHALEALDKMLGGLVANFKEVMQRRITVEELHTEILSEDDEDELEDEDDL
jgi:hypothetical protein